MMKLEVGQVFKNVKFVGEWLGEVVLTKVQTKTKNKWLKELDRYCKWHKEGQKIIIDEVYETPLEKVDGRSTNTFAEGTRYVQESYFKEYLKEALLDYLTNKERNYVGSVYGLLGKEDIFKKTFFKEHRGDLVQTYLSCVGSKIYKPFTTALKELQEENKIKYDRVMLFKFIDEDEEWILPEELLPLYEKAYAYAEKETNLKPFKKYSYILSCVNEFRPKVIEYMNKHMKGYGDFDKQLAYYRVPYVIEKGVKFIPFTMLVDNKKKLMENIHKQVSISKMMQDAKGRITKFGQDREKYFVRTLEKCSKSFFYIEEIEQIEGIEKKIKFHSLHSDLHIAIREINELNTEYHDIMKKDNVFALEFLANIEAEKFYRELEKYEEEEVEDITTFEYPIKRIVVPAAKAEINKDLAYQVWLAQSR